MGNIKNTNYLECQKSSFGLFPMQLLRKVPCYVPHPIKLPSATLKMLSLQNNYLLLRKIKCRSSL